MPSLKLAAGRLRVRYPDSYDLTPEPWTSARVLREPPGAAGSKTPPLRAGEASASAPLLHAIANQGLDLVEAFELVPAAPTDPSGRHRPRPARRGRLRVALDLPRGQNAVILIEQDGFFSWHLPDRDDRASKGQGPGTGLPQAVPHRPEALGDAVPDPRAHQDRVARFEIDVRPVPTRRRARTRTRSSLGPFGEEILGRFTVRVLTFAFRLVPGALMSFLERDTRPGLVRITGEDVARWPLVDDLSRVPLPDDRPARILLLVHGTFSTTVGSFGVLTSTAEGQEFLRTAASSHDAVIGFDHRTLSRDPLENAIDLCTRLQAARLAFPPTIDIVSYSRGALVARSLVEYLLPSSAWRADIGTVVFVAGTNAGTQLAEPENLKNFVDLYTTLAAATARSIAATGSTQATEILGGLVHGIGALVKYLVLVSITQGGVPGLAAMEPDGTFVTEINRTQPGQPGAGTPWRVISSNFEVGPFEVGPFDDQLEGSALPAELLLRLADGLADRLMGVDNDLVVDTASMSSVDLPSGGGFITDSLAFGTNGVVHHLNYLVSHEPARRWRDG